MKVSYSVFSLGDQAVSLEIPGDAIDPTIHQLLVSVKFSLESNPFAGLKDVVLGYRSVAVHFDLLQLTQAGISGSGAAFVKNRLSAAYQSAIANSVIVQGKHHKIPVCYSQKFGFDIDGICTKRKITPEQLVQLHTSQTYNVYLIGFLPGFPYLGFVDPRIEMPRHNAPRTLVPAGSVGIAGKQTGIYPFDSPGGWQIIGRTPMQLFNAEHSPPVIAEAGDTMSFYPITEEEFDRLLNLNR